MTKHRKQRRNGADREVGTAACPLGLKPAAEAIRGEAGETTYSQPVDRYSIAGDLPRLAGGCYDAGDCKFASGARSLCAQPRRAYAAPLANTIHDFQELWTNHAKLFFCSASPHWV